jgi:hypothetical protein
MKQAVFLMSLRDLQWKKWGCENTQPLVLNEKRYAQALQEHVLQILQPLSNTILQFP